MTDIKARMGIIRQLIVDIETALAKPKTEAGGVYGAAGFCFGPEWVDQNTEVSRIIFTAALKILSANMFEYHERTGLHPQNDHNVEFVDLLAQVAACWSFWVRKKKYRKVHPHVCHGDSEKEDSYRAGWDKGYLDFVLQTLSFGEATESLVDEIVKDQGEPLLPPDPEALKCSDMTAALGVLVKSEDAQERASRRRILLETYIEKRK